MGRELAGAEPGHGALTGPAAYGRGRLQFGGGAGRGPPVIALHALAFLGHHRAAQAMAGAGVAGDETVAVAIDVEARLGRDTGTLGVDDARVETPGSVLADDGQFDGRVRLQVPGMIKVQLRQVPGHQVRVRQAGIGVLLGTTGDGAGGLDGVAHRLWAQVGGTGGTLALAEIHCDAQAIVPGVLDRLYLTQANADLQPGLGTGGRLGRGRALALGLRQQIADNPFQTIQSRLGVIGGNRGHNPNPVKAGCKPGRTFRRCRETSIRDYL